MLLDATDDPAIRSVEPIPRTDLVMVAHQVGKSDSATSATIIGQLDRSTGKFARRVAVADCLLTDGVVDHDVLVATAWERDEAHVVALDLAAGTVRWRFAARKDLKAWRIRNDGHVLVASSKPGTSTGETWALTLLDAVTGAVAATGEAHTEGPGIVVPSDDGELYATVTQVPPDTTDGRTIIAVQHLHLDGPLEAPLVLPGFDRPGEPEYDNPAAVVSEGSVYYLDTSSKLTVQRLDTGAVVASVPLGIWDPSRRYGHRLQLGPTGLWISAMGASGRAFAVIEVDLHSLRVKGTRTYTPYFAGTRVQHPVFTRFSFGRAGPVFQQCPDPDKDARLCRLSLFLETPSSP